MIEKLRWYQLGHGISDRQWNDVLGVLKIQGDRLDKSYMKKWADKVGVGDLLSRAFDDAGIAEHDQE